MTGTQASRLHTLHMKRSLETLLFLLVVTLLSFSAPKVYACSCVQNSPVDLEFLRSPNVVVLKARSIEKTDTEPPRLVNYGGIKQTRLTVEKVFRGTLKVGQELIFAQGGGADCIWTFTKESIGQEFLFYLASKPLDASNKVIAATGQFPKVVPKDVWIASTCSRSGGVKYKSNDLKYLENISTLRGKTRLSGLLSQYIEPATADQNSMYNLLGNYMVKVTGNGKNIALKLMKTEVMRFTTCLPESMQLSPKRYRGINFTKARVTPSMSR